MTNDLFFKMDFSTASLFVCDIWPWFKHVMIMVSSCTQSLIARYQVVNHCIQSCFLCSNLPPQWTTARFFCRPVICTLSHNVSLKDVTLQKKKRKKLMMILSKRTSCNLYEQPLSSCLVR